MEELKEVTKLLGRFNELDFVEFCIVKASYEDDAEAETAATHYAELKVKLQQLGDMVALANSSMLMWYHYKDTSYLLEWLKSFGSDGWRIK